MVNRKGKASTELIMVMILLVLFSAATLTLVSSGTSAYSATTERSGTNSKLRIAASYIFTKARQSMEQDSIKSVKYDYLEGDSIVMLQQIDGIPYETIIFVHEGYLSEAIVPLGSQPDPESSFQIVELDQLIVVEEDKGISFKVVLEGEDDRAIIEGYFSTL